MSSILRAEAVAYTYSPGTAYEKKALQDINLEIEQGEFLGIIGHTGSGKSTLITLFNGLEKPTEGKIYFHGQAITEAGFSLRRLRMKVGLVFQYPEHQLFDIDVLHDVSFGPKNRGLSEEAAMEKAKEACRMVGLDESYDTKSPFELSGGEKRRVAIAGILAMEPEVLILDEPTAGLDPAGRTEILDQVKKLHEQGLTIILVSHSMEDVAKYADRLLVLCKGKILFHDVPSEVFCHYEELEEANLQAPDIAYLMNELYKRGLVNSPYAADTDEACRVIMDAWKGGGR
ncbi:MAG: energy-coupling factor transporter ATPase [Lachnospiraceae bacterium]|nr:energy-coupling factor transporter ATPase [Lachnospiraceae bacterium]MDY5741808.1 energy-coupling factor transporter ATPase [Lachnospiraceae bacterium]